MRSAWVFAALLVTAAVAARAADPLPPKPAAGAKQQPVARPTARQLVERIKQHLNCPWSEKTVDTFKAGNPDAPVTGVVTTFTATLDVLERAAAAGANFIVTHEPTFYNHLDKNPALEDDPVVAAKRAFIEKHGLIVWRFHDHWHRRTPDGITQGVVEKLGWANYVRPNETTVFALPETTLQNLAEVLKQKLNARVVRVVGKPDMKLTMAGMSLGAAGSATHFRTLQRDDVQVLLIGESPEWETVEYVRDATAAGKAKALVLLGHANSEEAGMENCAKWLKEFIGEVPVTFIPAGDPFWSPR